MRPARAHARHEGALVQVLTHVLAGGLLIAQPIQQVVEDLEGQTEVRGKLSNRFDPGLVDAGDPASFFDTDQRGYMRPADGDDDWTAEPDIASVEFGDPISVDSFETGDTSNWSATVP